MRTYKLLDADRYGKTVNSVLTLEELHKACTANGWEDTLEVCGDEIHDATGVVATLWPADVFFKYLTQLRAIHVPLLHYVKQRLSAKTSQIQLSFNQMNVYEYINEHDEDYVYHTFLMEFTEHASARSSDPTRMVFAENNVCSKLLFEKRSASDLVTNILQPEWTTVAKTRFDFSYDTGRITAEKMEVLFTVHFYDVERQVQLFKLLYFEDTLSPAFGEISVWSPPDQSLIQVNDNTWTV